MTVTIVYNSCYHHKLVYFLDSTLFIFRLQYSLLLDLLIISYLYKDLSRCQTFCLFCFLLQIEIIIKGHTKLSHNVNMLTWMKVLMKKV